MSETGGMELTREQFAKIAPLLPRQRGNVSLDSFNVINAILFVAANGCKWRALPDRFGRWHSIYTRMSRWAKAGVLDEVFSRLQTERIIRIRIEAVSLDSTVVKVHPDGTGASQKKTVAKASEKAEAGGPPNFIWLPRVPAML